MTSLGKNGSVEFRFYRPGATDVRVMGSFNGWSQAQPMHPDGQGWWVLKLDLNPGEYQFRYVADGVWYTDFASNGIEVTKFGWNSVLIIPRRAAGFRQDLASEVGSDRQGVTQNSDELLVA